MPDSALSPDELHRYARQIGPGVLSAEGQSRLKRSAVLITRAGGMGGPAALCLTMAGVGRVVIAHGGEMTSPDLNRQVQAVRTRMFVRHELVEIGAVESPGVDHLFAMGIDDGDNLPG